MKNTVFLNASRLDFDNRLDFSPISGITHLIKHSSSTGEEILERVKNNNIVITKELLLGREMIARFPSTVELICEAGTGYNNIDLAAAGEKGISVCNVPGYSTGAVVQLAVTFMLNLSSSMAKQQRMIERGNLDNFSKYLQVPHFELLNKTVGIIGGGTIGTQVINIALALGMDALVYTRTPKTWNNARVRETGLDELLRQSDFISIHCPLNEQTRHLIDMDRLKLMKTSAFLINTSRGAVIKEADLIAALKNGIIAGAALDVQDPEPPEPDNPLFAMDNVILTPHIGWKCIESRQRLIEALAGNIEAFVLGKPTNLVK